MVDEGATIGEKQANLVAAPQTEVDVDMPGNAVILISLTVRPDHQEAFRGNYSVVGDSLFGGRRAVVQIEIGKVHRKVVGVVKLKPILELTIHRVAYDSVEGHPFVD